MLLFCQTRINTNQPFGPPFYRKLERPERHSHTLTTGGRACNIIGFRDVSKADRSTRRGIIRMWNLTKEPSFTLQSLESCELWEMDSGFLSHIKSSTKVPTLYVISVPLYGAEGIISCEGSFVFCGDENIHQFFNALANLFR